MSVKSQGYSNRYLKIQWLVVTWRLLALFLLAALVAGCPERLESIPCSLMILSLAFSYMPVYAWLAMRTRAAGSGRLQILDFSICSLLMFLAQEPKLIFIMSFYAFSCLLSRDTTRLRQALPGTVALSLVFVLANAAAGLMPHQLFTSPPELGNFFLFYFFGIGFVGLATVLEHVSSLELDAHLEEQRRSYRRRLHDDLGNLLCGLHFKIQSLAGTRPRELRQALDYLAAGYHGATVVLKRLLSGIEEAMPEEINASLSDLKRELELAAGIRVILLTSSKKGRLSSEVQREVLSIIREAAMNAVKHSGVRFITMQVTEFRGRLRFIVSDNGHGIDKAQLARAEARGRLGIRNMRERARQISGRLTIDSLHGGGTRVILDVEPRRRTGVSERMLDYNPQRKGGSLYTILLYLKLFIFLLVMVQALLLPPQQRASLPVLATMGVLALNCIVWLTFRDRLYRLLSRRPWLLIGELIYFVPLFYICLGAGLPVFFSLYIGSGLIMGAYFAGLWRNSLMALFLNAGIFISYLFAPEGRAVMPQGQLIEDFLTYAAGIFATAISAGLAGEFIDNLEDMQLKAINRALARQRERLTSETHRQLQSLINSLGCEIQAIPGPQPLQPLDNGHIGHLLSSSRDVKDRLRGILVSLENGNGIMEEAQTR